MSRSRVSQLVSAAAVAAVLTLAGCGLGAGPGTKNAAVTVTENFGSRQLASASQKHVPGSETVMTLLQRSFNVDTRYGGGFVQAIDGRSGGGAHDDWFYYVNGVEAPKGAARTAVQEGDRVWWDLHDWSATDSVPAVVGSYPEPFTTGLGGRRFPTVLDCATNVTKACNAVGASLRRAGVKVASQLLGGGSGSDSLAVVVGTWKDLAGVIAADLVGAGPAHSGVYAQFVGPSGQALELDNPKGQVVRTLRAGAGLVAATDQPSLSAPVWLITGTDAAGVDAAAAALTPAKLHDHFAVAVSGGQTLPIPLEPSR